MVRFGRTHGVLFTALFLFLPQRQQPMVEQPASPQAQNSICCARRRCSGVKA